MIKRLILVAALVGAIVGCTSPSSTTTPLASPAGGAASPSSSGGVSPSDSGGASPSGSDMLASPSAS